MIQRIHLFFLIVFIGFVPFECVISQTTIGAGSLAMGRVSAATPTNPWNLFGNPAFLSTDQRRVSFYGFRYAGITEITDFAAEISVPVAGGGAGIGVHRYGFNLFNETHIRTGYKYQAGRLHGGVVFNYSHILQGGGYGSASAFGVHAGLAVEIADGLWLGTRALNLNQPAYNGSDELLPRELAIGVSFQPADMLTISSDAVKDVRFPVSIRAGIESELVHGFHARTGVTTRPETYSGGFGYRSGSWQMNIAVQQHIPLGISPALDFGIQF